MTLTPQQVKDLGYDPSQPGSVLRKSLGKATPLSSITDSRGFHGHGGVETPKMRIRQSQRPLVNKLEAEFAASFKLNHPGTHIYEQAMTFRLCNGVQFTPDCVVWFPAGIVSGIIACYDVKGNQPIQDDASVKLKIAAHQFPDFGWFIVWKDGDSRWQEQRIIP